jgi:hypothetical protein
MMVFAHRPRESWSRNRMSLDMRGFSILGRSCTGEPAASWGERRSSTLRAPGGIFFEY